MWETRNGKRPPEMNGPAATYVETHGAIAVAGSDDHAGVDIGRTYTEAAPASTPEELLAEAFLVARDREPRLHLVLAGHGPAQLLLQARLGPAATFLGALGDGPLAEVFASADLLVSPSASEHCPEAVLEAQASGLPVLAVDAGGATELIDSGRSGSLVPADPGAMAMAIRGLSRRGALRERLSTGGLLAVRERTWSRSLAQLAEAYGLARIDGPVSARTAVGTVARAA